MKNIVTDVPQDNMEIMMNLAFVKDNEVWIRGGGVDGEDCTLIDFSKQMCMKNHECQFDDGFPADLAKDDFDQIGDLFMECSMCRCPIGTTYFIAIQAAELRELLKEYQEKQKGLPPAWQDGTQEHICQKCGGIVWQEDNYCSKCGQAVKWT